MSIIEYFLKSPKNTVKNKICKLKTYLKKDNPMYNFLNIRFHIYHFCLLTHVI